MIDTLDRAQREAVRAALLTVVAYCPSELQCLIGDPRQVAENCRRVLGAANQALEHLTGQPSNVITINHQWTAEEILEREG